MNPLLAAAAVHALHLVGDTVKHYIDDQLRAEIPVEHEVAYRAAHHKKHGFELPPTTEPVAPVAQQSTADFEARVAAEVAKQIAAQGGKLRAPRKSAATK